MNTSALMIDFLPWFGLLAEGEAIAEGAEPGILQQIFGNPLNLVLISGILFIMLVLRPQQKQMKELQDQLANLKKNDRVITSAGIHGTITQANADESTVVVRIDESSGTKITINRDAIAKIVADSEKDESKNDKK